MEPDSIEVRVLDTRYLSPFRREVAQKGDVISVSREEYEWDQQRTPASLVALEPEGVLALDGEGEGGDPSGIDGIISGYDYLTVPAVIGAVRGMGADHIDAVIAYERANRNRTTLLPMLEDELASARLAAEHNAEATPGEVRDAERFVEHPNEQPAPGVPLPAPGSPTGPPDVQEQPQGEPPGGDDTEPGEGDGDEQ